MANGVFDRLVSNLSQDEKKVFLERLSNQGAAFAEPMQDAGSAVSDEPVAIEERYKKVFWFSKLIYFIISVFTGKSPMQVFAEKLVGSIGKAINERFPGIYDHPTGLLLPQFYNLMEDLKEATRFFYTALDATINKDRGSFYAFMGSLEMEEVNGSLSLTINPQKIAAENPGLNEIKLRQIAHDKAQKVLEGISDVQREKMYKNSRSLYCLKELSTFLYDRLLTSFKLDPQYSGHVCHAVYVKAQLTSLSNIMFTMKNAPSLALLGTMFIFMIKSENERADPGTMDSEVQKLLQKSERSIAVIRDFNRKVPLRSIVRCANRDVTVEPRELTGGEDWFKIYHDYWETLINTRFHDYIIERRRAELKESFLAFFNGSELEELKNIYTGNEDEEHIVVENILALSFLLTFYKRVFITELNVTLRPILIDGEFYKKDNRTEFAESYNELIKLDDTIKRFSAKIAAEGEWGKQFKQINKEVQAAQIRHRKLHQLQDDVDAESAAIVERAGAALTSMFNVINGISSRDTTLAESPEKYDTLSNLAHLAGKGTQFYNAMSACIEKLRITIKLLNDVKKVEAGSDD